MVLASLSLTGSRCQVMTLVWHHHVLERGAIKLLKAKEGYLRVVSQAPPLVREEDLSRLPS